MLLALALAVAACATVTNTRPTLEISGDVVHAHIGLYADVRITIDDEHPDTVTLTATADDPALVPDTGFEHLGSGTARTIRVTPDSNADPDGSTSITVTARDQKGLEASDAFTLVAERRITILHDTLTAAYADAFGHAIAIAGDTLIIGAPQTEDYAGAAFVFQHNGTDWVQTAKLTASDAGSDTYFGYFGWSVAIQGNYALVGAAPVCSNAYPEGAVYIFHRTLDTWTEAAKITPDERASCDGFGYSVALDDDHALIGAVNSLDSNPDTVHVFARTGTTWSEIDQLHASNGTRGDEFGHAIAIVEGTAIIGAPRHYLGDPGIQEGVAYVYQRSGSQWTEAAMLTAGDTGDRGFGCAVALDGDDVLIGAPWAEDPTQEGTVGGVAYVFQRTGSRWSEVTKLYDPEGAIRDDFGHAVAIQGDVAIVGTFTDTLEPTEAPGAGFGWTQGSAFVFQRTGDTWTEVSKLIAADAESDAYFGASIGLTRDHAIIGADAFFGDSPGAAYIYER